MIMIYAIKHQMKLLFSHIRTTTAEMSKDKHDGNDIVTVRIRDNGQGIDLEILPRLFTKFATKSELGGTGLGLLYQKVL